MRLDGPVCTKFKRVCADSTNISILTKRATMVEIQVTFYHMSTEEISSGKLPLPLNFQDPLNRQRWSMLAPIAYLPAPATKYVPQSRRS